MSNFMLVLNEIRNSDRKAACVCVGGGGQSEYFHPPATDNTALTSLALSPYPAS